MKKLVLIPALLLFLFLTSFAGNIEHIYYFNSPVITHSGEYQTVSFQGALLSGMPGEPILPYQQIKLMLPPGESAESIEIIGSDEVTLEGRFHISPQQNVQPVSIGKSEGFIKDESVYSSDQVYPVTASGHLMTAFLNGHSYALSTFTPVRYIPGEGKVTFYTSVKVIVHTKSSVEAHAALNNLRQNAAISDELNRFSDNPQLLETYSNDAPAASGGYEILVITPAAYIQGFNDLKAAYLREGYITNVTSTEDIAGTMTGIDLQEKIRNYIIQEYQQHGIQHVILGGDNEFVPSRGFYCHVQSSSIYEDYGIPSDLYYAGLDGNWNTDGDEMWAEPGEDDLLQDISVGRLSFSNLDELQHMIHKSISYQFTPVQGELNKVLLAGENLYSNPDTWGSDYLNLLIGLHTDNGYTTVGIPGAFPVNKMYDENSYWSGYDLISKLNEGYPMLNHSGHANETYVMKLSNFDITDANFYNVNGTTHNYNLVYTHGCLCGSFDYDDCIGEKMVSISNFAAAFVGNSRYGWFNEGQTEGPSEHLHREFIDALFTDKLNRLGRAHMESKIATAPWVTAPGQWEPGAIRWCFYDCNVLGDPAMAIWTNNPINILTTYPANIQIGSTGMNVNVRSGGFGVAGLNCVMLMNGVMLGKGVTDTEGNVMISFDSPIPATGNAELVVSGYNCIPTSYAVSVKDYVGMDELHPVLPSFVISPNPVKNELVADFEIQFAGMVSIIATSADGKNRTLQSPQFMQCGKHILRWDASKLAPGAYTCTIIIDEQIVNRRFVKL